MTKLSIIQQRLVDTAAESEALRTSSEMQSILYQHSVFCQTGLPYRDPGDNILTWERANGDIKLKMTAGEAMHPTSEKWIQVGLPFGSKPRLILAHINAVAMKTNSAEIETERNLTTFVSHRLNLDPGGYNVRTVKEQLMRLSACTIRLGMAFKGHAVTVNSQIVSAFDVWADDREKVLWPRTIKLSGPYFQSLQLHAVPLNEDALDALAHSSMALDIYAWMAQRMHRVPAGKPALVPWVSLHTQFGWNYAEIRMFRRAFLIALKEVHSQYPSARFEVTDRGLYLWTSPPPVPPKILPAR